MLPWLMLFFYSVDACMCFRRPCVCIFAGVSRGWHHVRVPSSQELSPGLHSQQFSTDQRDGQYLDPLPADLVNMWFLFSARTCRLSALKLWLTCFIMWSGSSLWADTFMQYWILKAPNTLLEKYICVMSVQGSMT